MDTAFTPSHRGGSGPPLVAIHGITDRGTNPAPRASSMHSSARWTRRATLDYFLTMHEQLQSAAPHAAAIAASENGRRRATEYIAERFEHIPAELIAHQIRGAAACDVVPLVAAARDGWSLDAEPITCPVRVVWGTADRLLPWPSAAARYRERWLPQADWVELEGIGHCPQLDDPLVTAQLILGFTAP